MVSKDMVKLQKSKPEGINGVFAVAKGYIQRLIINSKNDKIVLKDSGKVDLQNPYVLTKLYLPKEKGLVASKSDMDY